MTILFSKEIPMPGKMVFILKHGPDTSLWGVDTDLMA